MRPAEHGPFVVEVAASSVSYDLRLPGARLRAVVAQASQEFAYVGTSATAPSTRPDDSRPVGARIALDTRSRRAL